MGTVSLCGVGSLQHVSALVGRCVGGAGSIQPSNGRWCSVAATQGGRFGPSSFLGQGGVPF